MTEELTRIDSAVAGLSISPKDEKTQTKTKTKTKTVEKEKKHNRVGSTADGVRNIKDLEKDQIPIEIAIETQKTGWKLNTAPSTIEDKEILSKFLVTPPVKKIDLHFPLGLEVTARNMKGVTIKDALDAIHKQYKKKADDELGENPYLAGFEWDPEESWTRLIVHQKKAGAPATQSKKSKKKDKDAEQ
ncbi:hypothetical protein TCE0_042f14285 [Talaromyces pinophilus]|uniref:DUF6699 domain-containing protein n=1 Tax=Talaromyces pinophilus TaxID=128442 RepID=A0A6V8HIL7_TALPI|nr:hypothetical protein DPV78_009449 [Talaromyces pinophilus]PCG93216.1 Hypothetical protein PENO1_084630 [Penicillium occitanis (nom. inval.)]PCH08980.1 hypothetical protein PENOC_011500 [Penicillium occitanis (nom. inval.)]GAM41275.1 hypothetical protein TCE0_042f14285 [Talaromyces pinophilus]